MGGESPKQFRLLGGVPLVIFTLRRLAACSAIHEFLIATRADEVESLAERVAQEHISQPCASCAEARRAKNRLRGHCWRRPQARTWCWFMTRCVRW